MSARNFVFELWTLGVAAMTTFVLKGLIRRISNISFSTLSIVRAAYKRSRSRRMGASRESEPCKSELKSDRKQRRTPRASSPPARRARIFSHNCSCNPATLAPERCYAPRRRSLSIRIAVRRMGDLLILINPFDRVSTVPPGYVPVILSSRSSTFHVSWLYRALRKRGVNGNRRSVRFPSVHDRGSTVGSVWNASIVSYFTFY